MPSSSLQLTFLADPQLPAAGRLASFGDLSEPTALLPPGEAGTLPSVALTAAEGDPGSPLDRPAQLVPLFPALRVLAALPPGHRFPPWERPSDSLLTWSAAAKLALEVVAAGHIVPELVPAERPDQAIARWRAVPSDEDRRRLEALAGAAPPAAWAVRTAAGGRLAEPVELLLAFLDGVADACGRDGRRPIARRSRGAQIPWNEQWASALVGSDAAVVSLPARIRVGLESVADWLSPLGDRAVPEPVTLVLRLEPPDGGDGQDWSVALAIQAEGRPIAAADVWAGAAGAEAASSLARWLVRAAAAFSPLQDVLDQSAPTTASIDPRAAAALLGPAGEALVAMGIQVVVPAELRAAEAARVRVRVRLGGRVEAAGRVRAPRLGLAELSEFRVEAMIGDEVLDPEELEALARTDVPLLRWRGRWVRLDPDDLERARQLSGRRGTLSLTEALAHALAGHGDLGDGLDDVDVMADSGLAELVARLRFEPRPEDAELVGIHGELRSYQRRGVAWLQALAGLGLGGVLADEMGVGKSLQAIALMTSRAQDRPHLVVCPTSVVGHWERELARFAPALTVLRHHGPDRVRSPHRIRAGRVVVTSYAVMRRDIGLLSAVPWDVVVYDEAQQVKNVASKGARAARALQARVRVPMTGTPVENRLAELWSILDLANPGLLGNRHRFARVYANPIERWQDEAAAARLRRLVAPFLLRRTKADPEVSAGLPPMHEITIACSMTREQAALYEDALERAFEAGLGTNPFERRGRVLALLTALKQICNHPAQYRREKGPLAHRSGKLARVTELLEEVVAASAHALVFTQFVTMGHLLVEHLGRELGLPEIPFLHGGVGLAQRTEMVRRFQEDPGAPPILVVSLRAGGTGLTLHRATHVVHYDRWWNPAVEDQATGRAHRIGQTQPVTVHRLVTGGTVEERIGELLDHKRRIADAVVGAGEAWLSDLGDDELRGLLALGRDDVEDDDEDVA